MDKKYYTTIGLEIHAELKTNTKMFCSCKNDPDETRPNVNICPVCTAQPGALPVINKEAVRQVVRVGLAIGATIAEDFTEFDRKNYFYPDIPKGYQISQYKYPIVSGGHLADFDVTRVHLEEDTGNSKHDRGDFSLVDFNRAGVPLMELVTEAHTFASPEEAGTAAARFAREYQLLLWYLGASEANMEKGEMRVEANISVSDDPNKWGTKVEVKNLNSVRSAERAIKYEVSRMIELIEEGRGAEIVQETRGWDENKQATFSQRTKEDSQDYRYLPDPDLPKLVLKELFDIAKLKETLPELPVAKRLRYKNEYGIKDEDIETFINDPVLGQWFEEVASLLSADKEKIRLATNYCTTDLVGLLKNSKNAHRPKPAYYAELIGMLIENKISSRGAKDILAELVVADLSPMEIASTKDLLQKNDEGALKVIAQKIIDANPAVVATYKAGKENAIMSLVGQIMKETGGSANPQLARQILIDLIK
jgi:aspartyl-tRNA(Asn)/glutamyl-tRNA(Gln) amidotransferase subunit B